MPNLSAEVEKFCFIELHYRNICANCDSLNYIIEIIVPVLFHLTIFYQNMYSCCIPLTLRKFCIHLSSHYVITKSSV